MKRLTVNMTFASGLSLHPDSAFAQAGWRVQRDFGASLVICPMLPTPTSDVERRRQRVRRIMLEITPDDLYIDERALTLLEDPPATDQDDPYRFRDRAHGVYILYSAARIYHAPLKAKQIDAKLVSDWIVEKLPNFGRTYASYAVNVINPCARRHSGVKPEDRMLFDADVLNRRDFRDTYHNANFISEGLALVLYATDLWVGLCNRFKEGTVKNKPTSESLIKDLERFGFYKKERQALTRIVLWPEQLS